VGALLVVSTTVTAVLLHDTAYAAGTTFTYQGGEQTYTVPPGVTSVTINAVGAPGGTGTDDFQGTDQGRGGDGASVTATVAVTPGQVLYVEVGGPGSSPSTPPTTSSFCRGSAPAFNGGGSGAACGGGGGGASDVQTCSITTCTDLTPDTRLVVAGGGGGGGGGDHGGTGGAGGNAGDQAVTGAGPGGAGCSTGACGAGAGGDGGFGPPPGTSTCPAAAGTPGQGGGGQCGAPGQGNSGGGGGGYDGGGEGGRGTDGGGGGGAGSSYWIPGAADTSMTDPAAPPSVTITPGPAASGSQVHAVIQVETSPSYAGDTVHISSSQLQDSCDGVITFETLQGGSTIAPRTSLDSIDVILDDDGNVTVVVDGADCAPGSDLIEADLTGAPYLTATTDLDVEPPQVTPVGVTATPADEVETGNSATSGDSDVYTIFYVETSPVYAEQPVTISSPQLEDRCGQGWRWEPGSGTAIDQASGPTVATGTLDDDGNAVFAFKGASCAAGTSTVTADVDAGTHPTYTTTYTIAAPTVTLPSAGPPTATHRHHHRPHHGKGGSSSSDPPAMTVTASPDPLVETGAPTGGVPTLNVVKSDNYGGSSDPPSVPDISDNNGTITYTITVSNSGASALDGVVVSDPLSSNPVLTDDTFTAMGTGGASGFTPSATGAGFNDIDDTVDLPAGSTITYTVVADLTTSMCVIGLSNTVTLTPPAGAAVSANSTTTATDTDTGFIGAC
jgi:uncharacterized repeat protein (TIGR01451 family)